MCFNPAHFVDDSTVTAHIRVIAEHFANNIVHLCLSCTQKLVDLWNKYKIEFDLNQVHQ
jgi:hypothetical protein